MLGPGQVLQRLLETRPSPMALGASVRTRTGPQVTAPAKEGVAGRALFPCLLRLRLFLQEFGVY